MRDNEVRVKYRFFTTFHLFLSAMLKVNFVNIDSEKYYTEMLKNEQGAYYVKNHSAYGLFKGNGADELGITNLEIVYQDEAFLNLVNGLSIDGEDKLRTIYKERTYYCLTDPKTKVKQVISKKKANELMADNAEKYRPLITHKVHKPVGCIDLTFSAPKSFSIYHALAPTKEAKQKVLAAFKNALDDTTSAIEQNCFIRRGRNGVTKEAAKVILADFIHHVARPTEKNKGGDMQLHAHRLAISTALGKSGKWGAIDTVALDQARMSIGQTFINNLRYRTEHDLGLTTYDRKLKIGTTFGIKGISRELEHEFSQRSQVISQVAEPSMTPKQVDLVVKKTRLKKYSDYADEQSIRDWQCRAEKHGFVWSEVAKQSQSLPPQQQHPELAQSLSPEAIKPPVQAVQSVPTPTTPTEPKQQPRRTIANPKEREQFYSKLATELQTTQPKKGFSRNFLESKILEQSKGTYKEAQAIARDFARTYTRPSRVKSRLRLNYPGHRLIDFAGIRRRIARTIKRIQTYHKQLKNSYISFKMLCLYATGKISKEQWDIICCRKELFRLRWKNRINREQYILELDHLRKKHEITPDYVFLVRSYEAVGLLSHKNSQYWSKILLEAKEYREAERVKSQLTQWEERSLKIGGQNSQSQSQSHTL